MHRVLLSVLVLVPSHATSLFSAPSLPHARGLVDLRDPMEDLYKAELERGFSSRMSMLPVLRRLADVSTAVALDPCGADILATGLARPMGFGSRALVLSDELELAVYFNKSVAICDGSLEDPGIGLSRFFLNPAGLVMCTDPAICSARRTDSTIYTASMLIMDLKNRYRNFQRDVKRQFYKGLFTYNPETINHVDASLVSSGLKLGMRYVGVHMRTGDKDLLKKIGIDEFAALVTHALRSHSLNTVYVASDDPAAANDLRPFLESEFPGLQIIQAYSPSSDVRDYGNTGDDKALLALLADLTALQRSEVFIGSHKSCFARTAYLMRTKKQPSICIDGDFMREEGPGIIRHY